MYDYYEHKHRRRNQDLRPWACCAILLAVLSIVAIAHSCTAKEHQQQAADELSLGILTHDQQAEVWGRTIHDEDREITALDRVLVDRVERDWKER